MHTLAYVFIFDKFAEIFIRQMHIIKVGGVPEHFNMPWHYASDNNIFAQRGIKINWVDYSTGTGAMMQDIDSNKLDLAIVLTEGAVAAISNGTKARIVQWYTLSALNWGIHVAEASAIKEEKEIFDKKYAVSRMGSGSHLMAHVHAEKFGKTLNETQFVIANSLRGAETTLTDKTADVFFWEKYTTQPSVDKGIFRRIGEVLTPWPCFVVVASENFLKEQKTVMYDALVMINQVNKNFKNHPDVVSMIAKKYHLEEDQVAEWLKTVQWNHELKINEAVIENISSQMFKLGLTKHKKSLEGLIASV